MQGQIVQDRLLAPMRVIFEASGADVAWDGETRTVTGTKGEIAVKLTIDSRSATINGNNIELDVPATIIDGRTFVPTRFVSESLGADVSWDGEKRVATIMQEGIVIRVSEAKQQPLPEESTNNKNRLLNPSDTIIREAINEGKKGYVNVNKINNSTFKLPVEKSNLLYLTPEAWAQTPFFVIMRASALEDIKYKELTIAEAKKLLLPDDLVFELKTYGTSISMGDTFHFVFEQGGEIIQPSDIRELTLFAERTSSWPDIPAYYKVYHVYFSAKEINFNKPASLVFLYAGKEMSARFAVDFSKLK